MKITVAFSGKYIYAWFRQNDRNINVVHTNNNDNNIVNKLKEILESKKWNIDGTARCKYIYDYVNSRIDGMNSLGVVSSESSFSAKYSHGIGDVQYMRSDGRAYHVFVVAPEN